MAGRYSVQTSFYSTSITPSTIAINNVSKNMVTMEFSKLGLFIGTVMLRLIGLNIAVRYSGF